MNLFIYVFNLDLLNLDVVRSRSYPQWLIVYLITCLLYSVLA